MSTAPDSNVPDRKTSSRVARLDKLAMQAFVQRWHYTRSLENVPAELAKVVWLAVKDEQGRLGNPVTCSVMFPFVRSPWRIESLDLSDSGKWIVDSSLKALQYVPTLRDVRCAHAPDATGQGAQWCLSLTQGRRPRHEPRVHRARPLAAGSAILHSTGSARFVAG
jgi:hypothetical protein